MTYKYLVLPISEITNIDFKHVLERSPEDCIKSVDESKFLISYNTIEIPEDIVVNNHNPIEETIVESTISSGILGRPAIFNESYTEYDQEGFSALLNTEEWLLTVEE